MHYIKPGAEYTVMRNQAGNIYLFKSPSETMLANFLREGKETRIKMCETTYHGGESRLSFGSGIMYSNPAVGWNPTPIIPSKCEVGNKWTNVFDLEGFCNIEIVDFSLEEYKKIREWDFLSLFINYCIANESPVLFDYVC